MWGSRRDRSQKTVTCIACGETVDRSGAREYDKHGDRYDRRGKDFEYRCKPCDRDACHQPRGDLEATLVEAGAGETDQKTFLRQYTELVEDGRSIEESER
jgi:hypothetical protein